MASSLNALSYLDPGAYQNVVPASTTSASAITGSGSDSTSEASAGVSATAEINAMESQGDFQAYLSNSMALALLQPASTTDSTTTDAATLINNMLQQVLGAYQTQTAPPTQITASTAASGVSAVG
jgi:hypothetical protein